MHNVITQQTIKTTKNILLQNYYTPSSLVSSIPYKNYFVINLLHSEIYPLKQWVHDDSHSPKYQKFKTDRLPVNCYPRAYCVSSCGAPMPYMYDNSWGKGKCQCKVCDQTFVTGEKVTLPLRLIYPYCGRKVVRVKDCKRFVIHKYVNQKCSYYLDNKRKLLKDLPKNQLYKYKLHYLYREFVIDLFKMDTNLLQKNVSSLQFRKESSHIMGLCLTYAVNLGLSLKSRALFGLLLTSSLAWLSVIVSPTTVAYELVSLPCAWRSASWRSCLITSNSS